MVINKKGMMFVLSSPSGVGKTTLTKKLAENNSQFSISISHTTRKPRNNEVNGQDYHFVDISEFKQATMVFKTMVLTKLRFNPKNPVIRTDETHLGLKSLVANIRKNGLLTPIIVASNGTVIDGNRRLTALNMIGVKQAPVVMHNSTSHKVFDDLFVACNENNMAINDYYPESDYIRGLEVDERWIDFKSFHENIERTNPDGTLRTMEYNFLPQKIKVVSLINEFGIDDSDKFDSVESFILEHDKQLSHLIVDTMDHRPNFLKDVFYNEQNYSYLIKEWDSKNDGFTYHVKIFKINYELFNSKIHGEQLP